MSVFLNNEICDFIPLWENYNPSNKKNVICTSFFKMGDHYKNFNIYVNGLKKWITFFDENRELVRDWEFLIFIDNNIYQDKNVMDIINSCNKIKPVMFTCADYMVNKYHIDVFGALVRFFPLFDFANNFTKKVYCVDIDLQTEQNKTRIKDTLKMDTGRSILAETNKSDFFKYNTIPHLLAGAVLFPPKKYDSKILTDFIKKASSIKDVGHYNKRLSSFGFGTDELFLNKYFIQDNDITFWIYLIYSFNWFLYHFKHIITNTDMKPLTFELLKKIMGKYRKNEDINKMLAFIDKHTYNITHKTPENVYLGKNYYKVIHYLVENNIEWMPMHIMKIIIKYFDGIIFGKFFMKIKGNKLVDVRIIN